MRSFFLLDLYSKQLKLLGKKSQKNQQPLGRWADKVGMTMELRLFAKARLGNGPLRPWQIDSDRNALAETPQGDGTSVEPAMSPQAAIEREIARIIAAPPEYGQSLQSAFDAKEQQLRALFDRMAPSQRAALHESLASAENGGALSRLAAERRARLLNYLERSARP